MAATRVIAPALVAAARVIIFQMAGIVQAHQANPPAS